MVEQTTTATNSQANELAVAESDALVIDAVQKQGSTAIVSDQCYSTLDVQGTQVKFKIDTGSQANIIPVKMFNAIYAQAASAEAMCNKTN